MPQFPFTIPQSFSSYAEQFEHHPEKTIGRLEQQLKKQGPNAVGYFLLAWFHHLRDRREEAVRYAHRARIHAPGSPFFRKLHYYLSHPKQFEAWTPQEEWNHSRARIRDAGSQAPVMDLDRLIDRLSRVETRRIRPGKRSKNLPAPISRAGNVEDIISDTLADIHASQGKIELAIQTYRRLKDRNSEKEAYYREKIERLEERRSEGNGD